MNPNPLTTGPSRAPARAMLKAVGFTDADLKKPLIGVANTWIEIGPCNFHLRDLAVHVKEGIRRAGGTPMEFNTVSISDGITMGTEGMHASLVSREVIADSIELVTRGNGFDGLVVLVGCDKTIPAASMALARLNVPGLVLYGGSIAPGSFQGHDVTIQDVFEAVGAHGAGRMTDAELCDLEATACPGAGACGGQFTANTMAIVTEFLGHRGARQRQRAGQRSGQGRRRARRRRARHGARPREPAPARHHDEGGVRERDRVGRDDRRLDQRGAAPDGDRARSGRGSGARRLRSHQRRGAAAGGSQALGPVRRDRPARGRRQRASWPSVWSRPGSVHADASDRHRPHVGRRSGPRQWKRPARRSSGRPSQPIKKTGGLVILRGILAPEGCVIKVSGTERVSHRGPARVFDSEEATFEAVQRQAIQPGDVVVIRYEGPSGGPGHARDAGRDGGDHGRGAGRHGGPRHRRAVLGRHSRD